MSEPVVAATTTDARAEEAPPAAVLGPAATEPTVAEPTVAEPTVAEPAPVAAEPVAAAAPVAAEPVVVPTTAEPAAALADPAPAADAASTAVDPPRSDVVTESAERPVTRVKAPRVGVRFAGLTDVGRIREHNEDNFLIADLTEQSRLTEDATMLRDVGPRGLLLTVCDGMGGAAAGEVASQMAVDVVHGIVQDSDAPTDRDAFAQRLVASIQEAGARIFLAAKSNRDRRGMGTTSTVAGVYGSTLFVGQVGDSRAYLLREGRLRQITRDQSLVSKLIEAGQLTESEAETYEHAHIILQALGTADTVSVDLSHVELRKNDVVMLCSDGLSGLASFEQIHDAMANLDDPHDCGRRLIEMANDAGGHDNITVIVARFEGDLPEAAADDDDDGTYQPYVLSVPVEAIIAGRAATSLKIPDLPPPGSDVKNRISLLPEVPEEKTEDESPADDPLAIDAYTRKQLGLDAQKNVLGWVLVVLALLVLVLAAWLFTHGRGSTSASPASDESAPAPSERPAQVEPTRVNEGTPVQPVPVVTDDGGAADAS